MHICHVIESAAGGSAAVMVSLALDAAGRGHRVSIVYSPDRADPAVLEALRAGGVDRLFTCPMRRSVGPWDALDGLRLRRVLARLGKLDVIHSHSSKAGALARMFGPHRRVAQIYSPHGFYTMTGEAPFYIGPVERLLSHACDRVIAVSEFERQHGLELGIAPGKLAVVPNGIEPYRPLPRSEARAQLGIEGEGFTVGFVGRLTSQKAPLDAVAAIRAADPAVGASLTIIGDGELRRATEQAAAGAPVRFAGARAAKPVMSAFDALLCTSRYEGMPVAFLEALNCAVPIISYPVGGTDELVSDGETGFVTEPRPEAAADAIARLARLSPADREAMAEACRAKAALHSRDAMGAATLAVYESALKA